MSREPRREDPSETFGPYVLFECLGRGGMATVHRAKQTGIEGFERPVALKRMLPWLTSDPEFVKSFVREARLAAQLRHTNIAQTYDLGKVDGIYYIAMELITGRDLREVLRQAHNTVGPIPVPIAIHILFQICDALDYAHNFRDEQGRALGLVHRDISPANVIVGEDGCAKIVDFGVAKGSTATLHTQSGMLKGKFAYMAPEMLQGTVDARCDLFAVGVVAWELLTAKPLFAGGDDMEILQRVTTWDPPPPSSINPMVPRELDAWVQMALAKAAARRFQSAAQMRAGLELVARVPSMRATGPDVAAWIQWAFQQKRGAVTPAPRPVASSGDSVAISIEQAPAPPSAARPHPDSRPPTVRVPSASVRVPTAPPGADAAMGAAQTLLVGDSAVVSAESVSPGTAVYGQGTPTRPTPHPRSSTPPPSPPGAHDPITQPGHGAPAQGPAPAAAHPHPAPHAAPHPAPHPTPHPRMPTPHAGVPQAPIAHTPSSAMAMAPRAQRTSTAPAGQHATMIGTAIPSAVAAAASQRYHGGTAPPPPIAPGTVPPPRNPSTVPPPMTPHGIAAQHTPHGVPAQPGYTPQPHPAQPTPHAVPAQSSQSYAAVAPSSQSYAAVAPSSQPYPAQPSQSYAAQPPGASVPPPGAPSSSYAAQPPGLMGHVIASEPGATPGASTISLGDGPSSGTPAWAMQPRGPLQSPEYMRAADAYAKGTPEPTVPPGGRGTDLPLPTPPGSKGGLGWIVIVLLCGGAAVGGFFLVQHFL